MTLLEKINTPADLKGLNHTQLTELAAELREFIVCAVATKAGHLGASLGTVELTIALHYVFNTPVDQLIWDVGHQAYGHKILTGRREAFATNRQWGGLSGFPKRSESVYDAFGTGHSSTSISALLGMALAAQAKGEYSKQHIAVIGDASISSGMAFEALNHAGATDANLLIVLNDNHMGIDPSVGALKTHLETLGESKNNLFRALGFDYSGPVDGHDIDKLIVELDRLKRVSGPKLLHIKTVKGKGLTAAENDQITYHAPGKFDSKTGQREVSEAEHFPKYQDVFGDALIELAATNDSIVAISPAMTTGSGLSNFASLYPKRIFDVGISEQHALTFAAGLATQGLLPYCVIYSTFLQRAIDQLIHDIALQNLKVVLCIDRAGLVGEDGATHQGVFDLSFLQTIPNLTILAPKDADELRDALYSAQEIEGPIAIRYPRARVKTTPINPFKKIINQAIELHRGEKLAVISTGITSSLADEIITENKFPCSLYHFAYVKPLDEKSIVEIAQRHDKIICLEEGSLQGGFGQSISNCLVRQNICTSLSFIGVPDQFIEQGSIAAQRKAIGLDRTSIANQIKLAL